MYEIGVWKYEMIKRMLDNTIVPPIFRNGTLKSSINTGRYTADYLQCGNLPYLAWKKRMTAHILSYRRIRRYLALSLKATEEHVTLVM